MGKSKRNKAAPSIGSWEDVDKTMKCIGELQNAIGELELDMNRRLASVKQSADKQAKPLQEKIKMLERELKDFVQYHQDEMEGKSRKLTFGSAGFRESTKVVIPKSVTKEDFFARLEQLGMNDCIKVERSVLRDPMKRYPEDQLGATGAYLKTSNEFWYEIDREQLQPAGD
ncbi:MAG: host-nuclease inhibitor Gam family protein [Oscillospiraceae bacterium]